jgi:hypothetical protein
VEDNRPNKNYSKKTAEWGALKICEYKANHLIVEYELINAEQTKEYFRVMIKDLTRKNSDLKLIKLIQQHGLSELGY